MPTPLSTGRAGFDPAVRGYHAVYHEDHVNHCPGCGRTHWILGRMLAECAFCATALPLSDSYQGQAHSFTVPRRTTRVPAVAHAA